MVLENKASARLRRLERSLKQAFLVTRRENVRYLCGFTGSSGYLIAGPGGSIFVTDFRYKLQAAEEVKGARVVIESRPMSAVVGAVCRRLGVDSLAFETSMSFESYRALSVGGLTLLPKSNVVEKMRLKKDEAEAALIRVAVARAEAAFLKVKKWVRPGVTESSIAQRLEAALRAEGCRKAPFDIIVASGENSAKPHAGASGKKLAPGDLVTIDWGGEAGGYFSDMTRTFLLKGPDSARKKEIYGLVLKANRAAMKAVEAGRQAKCVDATARDIIKAAGYGEFFGHGLGHGVGLEVHEGPRVSPKGSRPLSRGMVFTVEPGVYIPGLGGVRIEDMVYLGAGGPEELTGLGRALEIIG